MNIRIIIPCYNSQSFIQDTFVKIKSVLSMVDNHKIHVVFIDDGSIDNTLDLLTKLCNGVESYYVFSKKNGGEGSARNFGLDLDIEKYDYVFFSDSDDVLLKGFNKAVTKLNELKSDMLVCSYIQTDFKSSKLLKSYHQSTTNYNNAEAIKQFLYRNFVPGIGNTFFKKSNIRFSSHKLGADSLYAFENLCVSKSIGGISSRVYNYKIRKGSAMDSQSFDNIKVALTIKKYISNNLTSLKTASNFFLFNEVFGYYSRTNKIIKSKKYNIRFNWFLEISSNKILKIIIFTLIKNFRIFVNLRHNLK